MVLLLVCKPQQYSSMKLISINILFFYLVKIITAPTGPSDTVLKKKVVLSFFFFKGPVCQVNHQCSLVLCYFLVGANLVLKKANTAFFSWMI